MNFDEYCDQAELTNQDREDFRDWFLEGPHTLDETMSLAQWDCQWEEFTGEPLEEEEIDSFQVELNNGPDCGGAIIEVTKSEGYWKEYVISASPDFYWPGSKRYMSYLKPQDILVWLRQDFNSARLTEGINRSATAKVRKMVREANDKFFKKGAEVTKDGDVYLRGSANDADPQMHKIAKDSPTGKKFNAIIDKVRKDNPELYKKVTSKEDIACDIRQNKKDEELYGIFADGEEEPSETYLVTGNKIVKESKKIKALKEARDPVQCAQWADNFKDIWIENIKGIDNWDDKDCFLDIYYKYFEQFYNNFDPKKKYGEANPNEWVGDEEGYFDACFSYSNEWKQSIKDAKDLLDEMVNFQNYDGWDDEGFES